MNLIEVNSAALVARWHQVPFALHQQDPHWVPYLRQEIEKLFDRTKNKLFQEGAVAIRWLVSDDKGKDLGRIAAFTNPRNQIDNGLKVGGLGFFESVNDKAVANLLFDAGRQWLEEKGMEAMDGPINFGDRSRYWGCQVSAFDQDTIYPMNYNPPYYQQLFEDYGFEVYFRQYVYWKSTRENLSPIIRRKYNLLSSKKEYSISTARGMSTERLANDFRTVYNAAWGGHSHYKEMSQEAALKAIKAMKPAIDPDIIFFVYHNNRAVAFFVNLPELNQIFKHVHGNLNWWGKMVFLYHKWRKTPRRMTGLVFGVDRDYQKLGLEALMIYYMNEIILKETRYEDAVLSWVGDFNPKMIKVCENLGARVWRTYHTYRYLFDRSLPFERAPVAG